MIFNPPANQDDLAGQPIKRQDLIDLWNRKQQPGDNRVFYMGDFVTAAAENTNYVDPRLEPPSGTPDPVPWNGFPRLLSRHYNDQLSETARAQAEATADILTPWLYWVLPNRPIFSAAPHHLPFYADRLGMDPDFLRELARPLHAVNPDNTIGDPIPQFRRQQDEYLEWHADRNDDGTLRRISFTAEPPDYWNALAEIAPERVVELYQDHVKSGITREELFYPERVAALGLDDTNTPTWFLIDRFGGAYNPLNRWTTTDGIMHLTHRANTLGAEVNLAGDASVPRPVDDSPRTPGQDPTPQVIRIACGRYGGINRSSDPNIGLAVGDAVKAGNRITLTDPVGLYIGKVDLAGLSGPNGEVLEGVAGDIVRGSDDPFEPRILRYEVKLPPGTAFTLSDCKFDNRPLLRGGQIARETTIRLYANTYPGSADATQSDCDGVVCRRADNEQIFLSGTAGGTPECPASDDLVWLLETPFEGDVGGASPMAAGPAAIQNVPASASGETTAIPDENINPYKLKGF